MERGWGGGGKKDSLADQLGKERKKLWSGGRTSQQPHNEHVTMATKRSTERRDRKEEMRRDDDEREKENENEG